MYTIPIHTVGHIQNFPAKCMALFFKNLIVLYLSVSALFFPSSRSSEQSESRHSSFKHHNSNSITRQMTPLATSAQPTCNELTNQQESPSPCNCHYGQSNTCAALASCESMGFCPVPDSFIKFDPKPDYRCVHVHNTYSTHSIV